MSEEKGVLLLLSFVTFRSCKTIFILLKRLRCFFHVEFKRRNMFKVFKMFSSGSLGFEVSVKL